MPTPPPVPRAAGFRTPAAATAVGAIAGVKAGPCGCPASAPPTPPSLSPAPAPPPAMQPSSAPSPTAANPGLRPLWDTPLRSRGRKLTPGEAAVGSTTPAAGATGLAASVPETACRGPAIGTSDAGPTAGAAATVPAVKAAVQAEEASRAAGRGPTAATAVAGTTAGARAGPCGCPISALSPPTPPSSSPPAPSLAAGTPGPRPLWTAPLEDQGGKMNPGGAAVNPTSPAAGATG